MSRVVRISDEHYERAVAWARRERRTLQVTLEMAIEALLRPVAPVVLDVPARAPEQPEAIQRLLDGGVLTRGMPAGASSGRRRDMWDEHDQRRDEED